MNEMTERVIITCAVTGGGPRGKNPHVPVTPKQIAESALAAAKAGAAIVHCHVRDPESGESTFRVELFREVVDRIRQSNADLIINLTGGGQGMLYIDDANPRKPMPAGDLAIPAQRVVHAEELLPDICSLDVGSMNWGTNGIYAGHETAMREMARRLQAARVKAEIEVFDVGPILLANKLVSEGLFASPPMFQFCLGIPTGAPSTTAVLLAMRDLVPKDAVWAAFDLGRKQMPMVAKAVLLGGNVRVGLEDNHYLGKGEFATNEKLVERAVEIIERLGASVQTSRDARKSLGLRERN